MRHRSSVLALVLTACSPPNTTQEEGKAAPRAVAPTPAPAACQPAADLGVWASFPGDRCGFELRDDADGRLALYDLRTDGPPPALGEVPPPCRELDCVYEGADTAAGPVVLAVVPSPHSGMPSTVLLGVATGERLVFIDLWDGAGDPVDNDFTQVGPAHALAPFVCGDRLALRAVERLDAGRGVEPPPRLQGREGLLDPRAPTAVPTPIGPESCVPVALPVP